MIPIESTRDRTCRSRVALIFRAEEVPEAVDRSRQDDLGEQGRGAGVSEIMETDVLDSCPIPVFRPGHVADRGRLSVPPVGRTQL
jgi:hypothetical protein